MIKRMENRMDFCGGRKSSKVLIIIGVVAVLAVAFVSIWRKREAVYIS